MQIGLLSGTAQIRSAQCCRNAGGPSIGGPRAACRQATSAKDRRESGDSGRASTTRTLAPIAPVGSAGALGATGCPASTEQQLGRICTRPQSSAVGVFGQQQLARTWPDAAHQWLDACAIPAKSAAAMIVMRARYSTTSITFNMGRIFQVGEIVAAAFRPSGPPSTRGTASQHRVGSRHGQEHCRASVVPCVGVSAS